MVIGWKTGERPMVDRNLLFLVVLMMMMKELGVCRGG